MHCNFGDLLKSPRPLYAHYGVYLGAGLVLEFAGERAKEIATARPRLSSFESFADGQPVFIVEHANCSTGDIYARAVEVQNGQPRYNLWSFNCEHLARYVMSGQRVSKQTDNVVLLGILAGIGWLATR